MLFKLQTALLYLSWCCLKQKNLLKSTQFSFHIGRTNSYLFFLDFEVIKSIFVIFKSNTSLLNKFLFRLLFKGSWLILFTCSLISFGWSFNTCISTCICHRQIALVLERIGVEKIQRTFKFFPCSFLYRRRNFPKQEFLTCFVVLNFTRLC